jgi:hypothetical protein
MGEHTPLDGRSLKEDGLTPRGLVEDQSRQINCRAGDTFEICVREKGDVLPENDGSPKLEENSGVGRSSRRSGIDEDVQVQ